MRRLLVLSFALLASPAALASGPGAPVRWHGDGMDAVLQSSDKPFSVVKGDTPLHAPVIFHCPSAAGCIVTISATDRFSGTVGAGICAEVDGRPALPGCIGGGSGFDELHQQKRVGPGPHTLVIICHSDNTAGTILAWEAEYRIYHRRAR